MLSTTTSRSAPKRHSNRAQPRGFGDGDSRLPDELLLRCLISSIGPSEGDSLPAFPSLVLKAQLRRLAELSSVCRLWRRLLSPNDAEDVWRALAREHLCAPASLTTSKEGAFSWSGLLAVPAGEPVLFFGAAGFTVVSSEQRQEQPARTGGGALAYYILRSPAGDKILAPAAHVAPPRPWRHLCRALGLLTWSKATHCASASPTSARHVDRGWDRVGPFGTGAVAEAPNVLMDSTMVLPQDAFYLRSQYAHLYPEWQARTAAVIHLPFAFFAYSSFQGVQHNNKRRFVHPHDTLIRPLRMHNRSGSERSRTPSATRSSPQRRRAAPGRMSCSSACGQTLRYLPFFSPSPTRVDC